MNFKKWMTTSLLSSSLLLSACGTTDNTTTEEEHKDTETLKVVTTIYPLEDFTKKIGGDFVEVSSIYPPNADAHSFEPSTKDMVALAESDLFIYSGVGVEGFAERAAEALKNEDLILLAAGNGLTLLELDEDEHQHEDETHQEHEGDHAHDEENHQEHEDDHAHDEETHQEHQDDQAHDEESHAHDEHADDEGSDQHEHQEDSSNPDEEHQHEHEEEEVDSENTNQEHEEHNHNHGDVDPHVWLDPILSIQLAENIKDSLIELMPEHVKQFEENFTSLKIDLEKLDEEFRTTIQQANTKHLLVAHSAYGYWEARYGIEQIAISGLSPTQEPSQKSLQNIIEESNEHQISYVIFDQNLTGKVAETIQKEIGAESLTLHNLESVTDENIEKNEDYFSIMRANLKTIETALN
ncbi:metal ABC transporter solute-binding protein, Zn/Mn family [Mesobacillus maritimus]|uniref:metal ABC transporter solute-binding protein, Zn/Mn family n=1 Tax=Mesobacillus maritimus TaxID=1643336 RepID=UPI00384D66BE